MKAVDARTLALIDDTDRLVEYSVAMDRMGELWRERVEGRRPDTLWLLGHEPVFTIGRRTPRAHLPGPESGIPVVETDRGGQLTYHGPGQLVGYLVVGLRRNEGVVDYIREVEYRMVAALEALGIAAERRETPPGSELLTGVWTRATGRKITSIGMRVGRGVSTHGFALNVTGDLGPWRTAVPCGLADVDMTSVERELGDRMPTVHEVAATVSAAFEANVLSGPVPARVP
ncbi:lipoyl(octanoyl) transferase LipB [Nocardia bovistercoris]|uniref:Octanoyltransferase n=1 Tax=Nocardia bovistercoris TaxID=2785916 RepID=A0A931I7J5_9NOCA|nr:lipoyl(octanoyl) transferase LipB [Nocardia bovistercoris]MBH0775202.1 lipoyl(octanoyl) transferase LipB [Nocardia bovistercoris]